MGAKIQKKIIREEWPRIRETVKKGRLLFVCDARKKGTDLKEKFFTVRSDAETYASDTAKIYGEEGKVGLAMTADLRADMSVAAGILAPYGKTLTQAAQFYAAHLDAEAARLGSHTVEKLAADWLAKKEKQKNSGKIKQRTFDGIRNAASILKANWGATRILALTTKALDDVIDAMPVSGTRKQNIGNLISQFLNYCIEEKACTENAADSLDYAVKKRDNVTIFTPEQAAKVMELCAAEHKDLLVYSAVCLFAGLRPGEAEQLTWENIHFEERTIHVLGSTSKVDNTRNVTMEENLAEWIARHKKDSGPICPQGKTLERRRQALHAALGYRATIGQKEKRAVANPDAPEWPQDVMRHSYGSYHLAKYENENQLAIYMGNSVQIIRKHYKRVVSKAATRDYWGIVPQGTYAIEKASTLIP